MRFRLGLGIGFAAGYVLGTRAGRERYYQIQNAARSLWESDQAAQLRERAAETLPPVVTGAMERIGELRHRSAGNGEMMGAGRLPA